MEQSEELLLTALRSSIHGQTADFWEKADAATRRSVIRLAQMHAVLPLVAQSLWQGSGAAEKRELSFPWPSARKLTLNQASRTASFLLLLEELARKDLHPLVLKGLICRDLYPEPEQRSSTDEDLLISPEEFPCYHEALLSCGLELWKPYDSLAEEDEVTYVDPRRDLYIELHNRPFSSDSEIFSPCNELFAEALQHRVSMEIYGCRVDTLQATDHLLYMLCHAYKHLLFSGVGIRQICDNCLFARRYSSDIDWDRLRSSCEKQGIQILSAAFFRIGERHLDIPAPEAFTDLQPDELPLLHDCVSGGLYGAEDPDRIHSSRITLDAAAAGKEGRRTRGLLASAFPPRAYMAESFPYLKEKPWLLPAAWGQRICRYLFQGHTDPSRSLQIGRERVELLKQYKVIS